VTNAAIVADRKRRAMLAWWTPARRRAWSALIARRHREGRYPPPPRRVWSNADRVAQGVRQRKLWQSGRFVSLTAVWRAQAEARWTAGVYAGQSDRMKALWAVGRFAAHAARHRALWRAGHWFGNRRYRGGLRAELVQRFPEHRDWLARLTDADLAGLLSEREELGRFGVPLDRIIPEGKRHAAG
jgi:hypothetical protein